MVEHQLGTWLCITQGGTSLEFWGTGKACCYKATGTRILVFDIGKCLNAEAGVYDSTARPSDSALPEAQLEWAKHIAVDQLKM